MRGKNRCYVCFKKHENNKCFCFPKDFPYKFRWCCNCVRYARVLTINTLEKVIKFYKGFSDRIERFHFIRRAKLLYKLINVI